MPKSKSRKKKLDARSKPQVPRVTMGGDDGDYVEMSATVFIESLKEHIRQMGIENNKENGWFDTPEADQYNFLKDAIDTAKDSQKFLFDEWKDPELVKELADTARTFHENKIDILPFSECWFEWNAYVGKKDVCPRILVGKNVCLIKRTCYGITFRYFSCMMVDFGFDKQGNAKWVGRKVPKHMPSVVINGEPTLIFLDRKNMLDGWFSSGYEMVLMGDGTLGFNKLTETSDDLIPGDYQAAENTLACLALLMARETKVVEKRPPAEVNEHRAKKGRVPLFSHKVVTIDSARITHEDGNEQSGIHRSSPRLHWRRGHVRTLVSGKKVGIPPCVVGAAEKGVIDKTYRIKPPDRSPPPPP